MSSLKYEKLIFFKKTKMSFSIVQTRKSFNSKPQLSIVPSSWLSKDNSEVYWPRNQWITLSKDINSMPNQSWRVQQCKLVGKKFKTYIQAEVELSKLVQITDSDDALHMSRGTRRTPAMKKQMFSSNSYQLLPPQTSTSLSNDEKSVSLFIIWYKSLIIKYFS